MRAAQQLWLADNWGSYCVSYNTWQTSGAEGKYMMAKWVSAFVGMTTTESDQYYNNH